jgi:hypothetical protein
MDRDTALNFLQLPTGASADEIERETSLRAKTLRERIENAPTYNLKDKYRKELDKLQQAIQALNRAPLISDLDELPVFIQETTCGRGASIPPPLLSQEESAQPPPLPSSHAGIVTSPPVTRVGVDEKRAAPARATGASHNQTMPPPFPWKRWMPLVAGLVLVSGAGMAVQYFWWTPRQQGIRMGKAVAILQEARTSVSSIVLPPAPAPGSENAAVRTMNSSYQQLAGRKVDALAWVAVALASAGQNSEASGLIEEGKVLLKSAMPAGMDSKDQPIPSEIANSHLCRLFFAQAINGDPDGAASEIAQIQSQRDRLAKADVESPPLRHEENARLGIALFYVNNHQHREALMAVNGIRDDFVACQALLALGRSIAATGERGETDGILRTLKGRADRIPGGLQKTLLLCDAADVMMSVGKKQQVQDYINAISNGAASGSISSSSGGQAAKGLTQLCLARVLRRSGEKVKFAKTMTEVQPQAFLLPNGTPDYYNQAYAFALISAVWADAGEEEQAASAAAKAHEAAMSVPSDGMVPAGTALPEAKLPTGEPRRREQALAFLSAALAESGQFPDAEKICDTLTVTEIKGEAVAAVSYWQARRGDAGEARRIAEKAPPGEARCRVLVALQYGIRRLPLMEWW